ncbi:HpcH/HpaI aldolase/citrate lyase family protein [Garciella nitratireducens]|uniref:Citrate lyase subunit beta / citryl-CoA lyase n=1 Tax=Garciella nitratireducens DSM 15102 TaxID=1121911 RepID=A0A1T4P5G3_9FIRM|nr:aldolase/citrate lyase family protein [Garciella nitratireducens]SJZ86496.1 citrate lyase subunit beta / citryl-CoA lyase [Garciella nitratireducens DSM 15102]
MESLRRSMLFMPGNNPGMLQNAGILGADSVILDLEDAVSINEKDAARILVRNAVKDIDFYGTEVVVRVNPLSTDFGLEDIKEIAPVKPDALMVTKATEEDVRTVSDILTRIEKEEGLEQKSIKIFPLIETAYGLEHIHTIIESSDRVIGILLGAEDLTADLGIKRTRDGEEIFYARSKVAAACKAHGIAAIDTPFSDMDDVEGFCRDVEKAKSLGLTGKAAINPRQVEPIHEIFAPSQEEITHAQRVIQAMEQAKKEGKGVFSLDGKMVDAPIIARAETTIKKAKLAGLL